MTRDAEAVGLLLGGSAPNYRNTLFDQCMFSSSVDNHKNTKIWLGTANCKVLIFSIFIAVMQDHRDNSFLEVLRPSYGKPLSESTRGYDINIMNPFFLHYEATFGSR
ncbi:Uncharacterized protein Fot_29589 [Forsythia ovata]|uniref:Uncharacterized protein n=1 Tax=Forsythia ovata TaxID=205694 RepID=A0ABD1TSR7_9LAMI